MNHHRRTVSLILAVVAAVLLASCSAGSSTSGNGSGSGRQSTVTIGLALEPVSLDFTKSDGAAIPQALLYNVYQNLVQVDQDGTIVPDLATSWTESKDRTTYVFTLTPDATFSNGAKFTAQDAKFSIDRVTSDWTISLKSEMDVVKSTTVLSPTKLEVTLKQPSNSWLYAMTTRVGAMFSRTGVSDLAKDPIGTGPYVFSKWSRGDSITLTRNPKYWGKQPYFKTVVFKYIPDPTAMNNALISGTINVIGTVQSPDSLSQFENNPKYQVIDGLTNGEVVLSFNNGSGPLKDKKLREAVRYAINHKALVDSCWGGYGKLIGSMVPPTDPWYQDLTGLYPYDRAKARRLLQESGKAQDTLRLRVPTLPYAVSCGTVVQSQLQQAGFKVKLDQLDFPAWLKTVFTNADYDMSIVAHVEPRDMGTVFGNPDYYTRYNNPAFRKLLAEADAGTRQQQVTDTEKAARMLSQDAAADWLFLLPNLVVADRDITGLPKNAISESFDVSTLAQS